MSVPWWLPIRSRRGASLAGAALAGTALVAPQTLFAAGMHGANTSHIVVIGKPTSQQDPLTYLADQESYAKNGLVTWQGNVRVWQGDHALRADTITYDRNSGVLAARGHVALVEPDGTTTYADYLEFTHGMHDGIGTAIYIRMQDNAKLAGNGLRRTNGALNDLSHAVYTACEICEKNPDAPPFWQFQAYNATQDVQHKRIEFDHAWLKMLGYPVFYFPFFSMSDPSVKRQSGFLMAGLSPHDRFLGTYFTLPYFWAIDNQQDLTVRGLVSSHTGPEITAQYRNRLNFGNISILGGVAYDTNDGTRYVNTFGNSVGATDEYGIQGYVFAKGDFSINRNWRAGANINLASSANYMRDYRVQGYGMETLNSNVYLEGFGVGSYARVDMQAYQGLNQGVISNADLPYVLPRFSYSFQGQPDALGGRLSIQTTDFDVYRSKGVSDQRGQFAAQWDRPFRNSLGQQWLLTARVDSTLYNASHLYQQPLYAQTGGSHVTGQVLPTIALKMNWPFLRTFAHGHGSQIFEPIAQIIAAPNTGNSTNRNMPNEDSLSYEFTDSTLFSLNRYLGTDRLDGGLRANVGIHQNWIWNGHSVEMLVGESIQEHITHNRIPYSGLDHHLSDPVGSLRVSPNQYVDVTARGRYNPWTHQVDYGEGLLSTGIPMLRLTAGYVYAPVTPYYYYATNYIQSGPNAPYLVKTNEVTAGFSAHWRNYHASAYSRRSLSRKEFVANGGTIGYANDCFGLDIMYIKQYTRIGGQQRNTTVMFNFTFKTIGTFGING
ncbi:LPS-assembly protein LptD [Gluconobacter wancherniae]|uniref:LPS-assembly protein LptD n=1 Tax=Gluconobacter wancherniae TaxID=1307955 RepID=UPI001B8D3B02|nr:LPS assembly protein LptD [Gluconobacter wancherniae]